MISRHRRGLGRGSSAGWIAAPPRPGTWTFRGVDRGAVAGDATHKAVEEMIKDDLAVLGIKVNARYLAKDPFNTAMTSGDYDLVFSETWGAAPASFCGGDAARGGRGDAAAKTWIFRRGTLEATPRGATRMFRGSVDVEIPWR